MRAVPQAACSPNDNTDGIKGIVHYGNSTATPNTTAYSSTNECVDEPYASLVPFLSKDVGSEYYNKSETVTVGKNSDSLFRWYLNDTSLLIQWDDPVSPSFQNATETCSPFSESSSSI
jgi:hypothetical protein